MPPLNFNTGRWKVRLLNMGKVLFPNMVLPVEAKPEELARNNELHEKMAKDPKICLKDLCLRTYCTFIDASHKIASNPNPSIHVPFAILCGDADKVAPRKDIKDFMERLSCDEAKLIVIEDGRHARMNILLEIF